MPFNSAVFNAAQLLGWKQDFQFSFMGSSVREDKGGGGFFSSRANFSSAALYRVHSKSSKADNPKVPSTQDETTDSVEISDIASKRQKLTDYLQSILRGGNTPAEESHTSESDAETAKFQQQCQEFISKFSANLSSESSRLLLDNSNSLQHTTFFISANVNKSLLTSQQTEEYKKYEQSLSDLAAIDPELYEKALGILATVGANDRDRMLEGLKKIGDFVNSVNQTNNYVDQGLLSKDESEYTSRIAAAYEDFEKELEKLGSLGGIATAASAEQATTTATSGEIITASANGENNTASISSSSMKTEQTQFNVRFALQENGSISLTRRLDQVVLNIAMGQRTFCDPLVLDLGGNGIDLTSAKDGVQFDIDGDGDLEQTGFVKGDDALLYLDKNGNGIADNGKELFGDQNGAENGFAELAKYDQNKDGKIDEFDEIYAKLRVWQDINSDGINQLLESQSLSEAGVEAIFLDYYNSMQPDSNGNIIAQSGSFQRADGSRGIAVDALFQINDN